MLESRRKPGSPCCKRRSTKSKANSMNSATSPGKITFHRACCAAKVSPDCSRSPQCLRAIQPHGIAYRRNDEHERHSCNGHQPSHIEDAIGRTENPCVRIEPQCCISERQQNPYFSGSELCERYLPHRRRPH